MNPIKNQRLASAFLCIAFLLSSCSDTPKSQHAEGKKLSGKFREIPGWTGIFQDTLPCPDCPGLLTWLEIFPNGNFKRISTKIGFEDALSNTYSENGKWLFNPKTGILNLQDSLEANPVYLLPQGDSVLILCHADGSSFQAGGWKLRRRKNSQLLPDQGLN